MNLAINARDAMPHGGVLTVAVEQVHLDGRFSRIHGYGRPGLYAMVTVSDTGEGMAEQTRQKIFEPFYTTKEVGKGTGLGLSVVYGIVNQHEGYIHVHSEPGIGTTFRIYLPFIVSGDTEENATVIEEQPVGGTETILLAEDNEIVRDLTVSVLRECGYTVITGVDGEDAVSRYEENKDSIQLAAPGRTRLAPSRRCRRMRHCQPHTPQMQNRLGFGKARIGIGVNSHAY